MDFFLALENVSRIRRVRAMTGREVTLREQKHSVILAFSQQIGLGPDPALCRAPIGGAEGQALEQTWVVFVLVTPPSHGKFFRSR